MGAERGQIVRSLAGHDKGQLLWVVAVDGEFLLLADGKNRKVTAPKRKRVKHTQAEGSWNHPIAQALHSGETVTNNELRRALAVFRDERSRR